MIRGLREKEIIPIRRAQMRIRVTVPSKDAKKVAEKIRPLVARTEHEEFGQHYELVGVIDPGHFRAIDELVNAETKGRGGLDVLNLRESVDAEAEAEAEADEADAQD